MFYYKRSQPSLSLLVLSYFDQKTHILSFFFLFLSLCLSVVFLFRLANYDQVHKLTYISGLKNCSLKTFTPEIYFLLNYFFIYLTFCFKFLFSTLFFRRFQQYYLRSNVTSRITIVVRHSGQLFGQFLFIFLYFLFTFLS